MNVLWAIVAAPALALLVWYAFSADPHWVAKDGRAFTCRVQHLNSLRVADSRWREAKAYVDDGHLVVAPRGSIMRKHPPKARFTVVRRGDGLPRGLVTFLVRSEGDGGQQLAVVRIPAKSRALPHVEALISH